MTPSPRAKHVWRNLRPLALAVALVLGNASTARAQEALAGPMATCDLISKMPPLFTLGYFARRSVSGVVWGESTAFFRSSAEERFFLAGLGSAAFGHAFCGPVMFIGRGEVPRAALSLGFRVGLPGVFAGATYAWFRARDDGRAFGQHPADIAGTTAAGLALVGGLLFDYMLLRPPGARSNHRPGASPVLLPTSQGLAIGVGGTL
jgi:hypothetical protein